MDEHSSSSGVLVYCENAWLISHTSSQQNFWSTNARWVCDWPEIQHCHHTSRGVGDSRLFQPHLDCLVGALSPASDCLVGALSPASDCLVGALSPASDCLVGACAPTSDCLVGACAPSSLLCQHSNQKVLFPPSRNRD